MSCILLAWELGKGFGHLGPFLGLAPRLLERGHTLHVAARDIASAAQALGDLPVILHQAPLCMNTYGGLQNPPLNYAEILMRCGYLEPAMLRGMMRAWTALMRTVGADAVIADHAPTALLAARGLSVGRALIGSSFNVPPAVVPTPNMRPWMTVPPERLSDSDRRVLAVINEVLPPGRGLSALHDIFAGAKCFLSGIPELDTYVARQSDDYLGLQLLSTGTAAPVWPQGEGLRIFAYLHADYIHTERALEALAASGAQVLVHVLGDAAVLTARYAGERMQFAPQLLDFRRVVAECGLCVCHGNVGTTLGMLQGGRPVLVLPKNLEHYLMGRAVKQLGVGLVVHPDDHAPDIASELTAILADDIFRRNAVALAQRHAGPGVGTMTDRAVARIEALVLQGAGPSS